jgi:hypothetical protein
LLLVAHIDEFPFLINAFKAKLGDSARALAAVELMFRDLRRYGCEAERQSAGNLLLVLLRTGTTPAQVDWPGAAKLIATDCGTRELGLPVFGGTEAIATAAKGFLVRQFESASSKAGITSDELCATFDAAMAGRAFQRVLSGFVIPRALQTVMTRFFNIVRHNWNVLLARGVTPNPVRDLEALLSGFDAGTMVVSAGLGIPDKNVRWELFQSMLRGDELTLADPVPRLFRKRYAGIKTAVRFGELTDAASVYLRPVEAVDPSVQRFAIAIPALIWRGQMGDDDFMGAADSDMANFVRLVYGGPGDIDRALRRLGEKDLAADLAAPVPPGNAPSRLFERQFGAMLALKLTAWGATLKPFKLNKLFPHADISIDGMSGDVEIKPCSTMWRVETDDVEWVSPDGSVNSSAKLELGVIYLTRRGAFGIDYRLLLECADKKLPLLLLAVQVKFCDGASPPRHLENFSKALGILRQKRIMRRKRAVRLVAVGAIKSPGPVASDRVVGAGSHAAVGGTACDSIWYDGDRMKQFFPSIEGAFGDWR